MRSPPNSPGTAKFRLRDIEGVLARHRPMVLGFAAMAALIAYLLTPAYDASTTLRPAVRQIELLPGGAAGGRPWLQGVFGKIFGTPEEDLQQVVAGGDVAEMTASLDELRKALAAAERRLKVFQASNPVLDEARQVELVELRKALAAAEQRLRVFQASNPVLDEARQVELVELRQDVDAKRAAYYQFYKKVSESVQGTGRVAVSAQTTVADAPLAPRRLFIVSMSFIISLLLGVLAVILWGFFRMGGAASAAGVATPQNFQATTLECEHCGWSGTGAVLEVPLLGVSGKPVAYACPRCLEMVAVHDVLTDREVKQDMEAAGQMPAVAMWSIRM